MTGHPARDEKTDQRSEENQAGRWPCAREKPNQETGQPQQRETIEVSRQKQADVPWAPTPARARETNTGELGSESGAGGGHEIQQENQERGGQRKTSPVAGSRPGTRQQKKKTKTSPCWSDRELNGPGKRRAALNEKSADWEPWARHLRNLVGENKNHRQGDSPQQENQWQSRTRTKSTQDLHRNPKANRNIDWKYQAEAEPARTGGTKNKHKLSEENRRAQQKANIISPSELPENSNTTTEVIVFPHSFDY
jgi:hypothetical protein